MPDYMVVFVDDENQTHANFFERYDNAYCAAQDAAVSLGWYVELYERDHNPLDPQYRLLAVM